MIVIFKTTSYQYCHQQKLLYYNNEIIRPLSARNLLKYFILQWAIECCSVKLWRKIIRKFAIMFGEDKEITQRKKVNRSYPELQKVRNFLIGLKTYVKIFSQTITELIIQWMNELMTEVVVEQPQASPGSAKKTHTSPAH